VSDELAVERAVEAAEREWGGPLSNEQRVAAYAAAEEAIRLGAAPLGVDAMHEMAQSVLARAGRRATESMVFCHECLADATDDWWACDHNTPLCRDCIVWHEERQEYGCSKCIEEWSYAEGPSLAAAGELERAELHVLATRLDASLTLVERPEQ